MRDMYEIMDRWGAWAGSDNSGVDWQPIAAGFKGLLLMERKHVSNAMMMKVS